jgi:hypothetical protein
MIAERHPKEKEATGDAVSSGPQGFNKDEQDQTDPGG